MQLPDQESRDKLIEFQGSCFVSAGAGTGKSTTIALKVVHLIRNQLVDDIRKIVAITYTNKAAQELKWKIGNQLRKILETNPPDKKILEEALKNIDGAPIGTIHNFCANLLKEYALDSNIDFTFRIVEENQTNILIRECLQNYALQYWVKSSKDSISKVWQLILKYDYFNSYSYQQALNYLHENFYLLEKLDFDSFKIKTETELEQYSAKTFLEHKAMFYKLIEYYDYSGEEKENANSLGAYIVRHRNIIAECEDWSDVDRYRGFLPTPGNKGKKSFVKPGIDIDAKDFVTILRGYLQLFSDNSKTLRNNLLDSKKPFFWHFFESNAFKGHVVLGFESLKKEYLKYLWANAYQHFERYFEKYKQDIHIMGFQDLVYYCAQLVKKSNVLRALRKQFRYFFIDEYQDTDLLQTELFNTICNDEKDGLPLFRVGDDKQSIYRFRGADVTTFFHEKKIFTDEKLGLKENLSVNMRSNAAIIGFVNTIFANPMAAEALTIEEYEPLIPKPAKRTRKAEGVFLALIDAESVVDEANFIAAKMKQLKTEYKNQTVALLFRSLNENITPYLLALKENEISHNVIGRRFYTENSLLRDLESLIKVCINPFDSIALIAWLRSALVGLKDQDIEYLCEANALQFLSQANSKALDRYLLKSKINVREQNLIKDQSNLIEKLQYQKNFLTLSNIIRMMLDQTSIFESTQLHRNSESQREAFTKVIDLAEALEITLAGTEINSQLFQLNIEVAKMSGIADEVNSNEEFSSSGQNAVQIMSLHRAKGLEFDNVFIANLDSKLRLDDRDFSLFYDYEENQIGYNLKGDLDYLSKDPDKRPKDRNRNLETREIRRLFYVGVTRAKKRIFLPITSMKSTKNSYKTMLLNSMGASYDWLISKENESPLLNLTPNCQVNLEQVNLEKTTIDRLKPLSTPLNTKETKRNRFNFFNIDDRPIDIKSYSFFSGTSLKQKIEKITSENTQELFELPLNISKTISVEKQLPADVRGTLIHSYFEYLNLDNTENHEDIVKTLVNSQAFQPYREFHEELIQTLSEVRKVYSESSLFDLVKAGSVIAKEAGFSKLFIDESSLQNEFSEVEMQRRKLAIGYIDLIIQHNQEILIIDYKSNQSESYNDDFYDDLLQKNQIPMKLYHIAVSEAFPQQTVKALLYHTETGKLIEYDF